MAEIVASGVFTPPYAVGREVEDIAALIQIAGGAAYAYGMSSGGVLALEAARSGLPVKKPAMYEPPFVGAVKATSTRHSSRG